jgi:SRSO17 transposase
VPQTIAFQTKPEIALQQITAARAAGLPKGVVLMDAGYGNDTGLRTEITDLGLRLRRGSVPTPRSGRRGRGLCQRRSVAGVADDHPSCGAATRSIRRSR